MKIQGDVGWNKEKLSKPSLHVYGKDDTQIMVYSMRRSPRRGDRKKTKKKTRELDTKKRDLGS